MMPAFHRPLTLADFAGRWVFHRRIATPEGVETGRVEGMLTFAGGEGGLVADERGRMRLGGGPQMLAERRLIWRAEAGRIAVFFADGRPFHEFDPGALWAEARHLCSPDDYRVVYDFSGFPDWRSVWRVSGPKKDYVMTTDHRRDAALD